MKLFSKEIKIALAAIVAVALLFYGISFLKGVNIFKPGNIYYVIFNDITGLAKNNAVYANGFSIGTVRQIDYDYEHPGRVAVVIAINDKMHLPVGTRGELVSSMLGNTTMNLILGKSNEYLHPGDSLQGGPHLGAMEQAGAMVPKIEQLLPKLDSIMQSVHTLLSDPSIAQTLHNAQQLTAHLDESTNKLNALLSKDIPALTENLNHIGENTAQLTDKLKDLNYAQTLDNVNQTVVEAQNLTRMLHQQLSDENGSIGLLLKDRSLYDNLNKTLQSSDSLLIDFRNHPKRYINVSVFGKKEK